MKINKILKQVKQWFISLAIVVSGITFYVAVAKYLNPYTGPNGEKYFFIVFLLIVIAYIVKNILFDIKTIDNEEKQHER